MLLVCGGGAGQLAAIQQRVDLRLSASLYSDLPDELYFGILGDARLDVQSDRDRVVRGQLQIQTLFANNGFGGAAGTGGGVDSTAFLPFPCSGVEAGGFACFDVRRAFIRVRFELPNSQRMHLTLGRARVSWGEGVLFNAGDLLFGTTAATVDFTEDTLRDESAMLLLAFIPFADFTFLETIVLPPVTVLTDAPAEDISAGLRLQSKLGPLKGEVSYLYRGGAQGGYGGGGGQHRFAVNLQGNLGVDWYLSSSSGITTGSSDPERELLDELAITLGVTHIFDLPGDSSLSLRFEGLVRPGQTWSETATASPPLDAAPIYAVALYPEISYAVNSAVQIIGRSIINPIDLSAQITLGVNWLVNSGLSLFAFPGIAIGDDDDTFGLNDRGGLRLSTGMQFIY